MRATASCIGSAPLRRTMQPIVAVSGLGAIPSRASSMRCRSRPRPWGVTEQPQPSCQPRPTPWQWTGAAPTVLPTVAPPAVIVTKAATSPVVKAPAVVQPTVVITKPQPVVTPPRLTTCEAGAVGCPCRADNTCNRGSRCEAHTCVTCKLGTHHCQCDDNGKCPGRTKKTGKLYCKSGICKKKVHHGIWPFSSTSYEGLGEVQSVAPFWAWAGIIGLTGFIFWATLSQPRKVAR